MASVQQFQSSFDERSIFSHERYDIRNRSYRDYRQKIIENLIPLFLVQLRFRKECTDEFKRHSDSSQSLEKIIRRDLRIHYCYGFREGFEVLVMVSDYQVDSLLLRINSFRQRGDAIIYGDDEIDTFCLHLVNVKFFQSISFVDSVRVLNADVFIVQIFGDELIHDIT